MSISIGIYDLFAYTIPGFLYLYLINEFLHLIGWNYFQLTNLPISNEIVVGIVITLGAYLAGHVFDYFAYWFCFRLLTRYKIMDASLDRLKVKYPDLNIQFQPRDWDPLFVSLRLRRLDYSRVLDTFGATNIMLRNVSFSFFLLALFQVYNMFVDFQVSLLIVTVGSLIVSRVAYLRSRIFYVWFFSDIFSASLEYGTSLKEVIEYNRPKKATARRTKSKS